jgi:phosphinothricin acetyltransferase
MHAVTDIFNFFIRESFAAYPVDEVSVDRFSTLHRIVTAFLVLEIENELVGFGFLKPFREEPTFSHTGVLTYFILPHYTGMGLGTRLLERLTDEAKKHGFNNVIAHISSKNTQSLLFHEKHGFKQVGRLERLGIKFDTPFDIIWVQKFL